MSARRRHDWLRAGAWNRTVALEEEGTVLSVDGEFAEVSILPQGTCESCPSASICHSEGDDRRIRALNVARAVPGQKVRVTMHAQMYLKGTILVYAVPMVMLVAGAIFGKYLSDNFFPGTNPDLMAAGVGFLSMAVVFLAAKLWSRKIEKSEKYLPVIEEIC